MPDLAIGRPIEIENAAATLLGQTLLLDSEHGAVNMHLEPEQARQLAQELHDLGNAEVQTPSGRDRPGGAFPPFYGDVARDVGVFSGTLQVHPVNLRLNGRTFIIESDEGWVNLQLTVPQMQQLQGELRDLAPS